MWKNLPIQERKDYLKLIRSFASLTKAFTQKAGDEDDVAPVINSKYQESVFQKAFKASAEDIGNTSYDCAIKLVGTDGKIYKYLVGIKTFGVNSGFQKVAQFKKDMPNYEALFYDIEKNAKAKNGKKLSKKEIDKKNNILYHQLAEYISSLRNKRIASSKANIQGFHINEKEDHVESVYHVLMPSKKGADPKIYVGEISYDPIDINHIEILGCTNSNNPTNFDFTDQNHIYRFTHADSQLLMSFSNDDIIVDSIDVKYLDDPYEFFQHADDEIYHFKSHITKSFSWKIANSQGKVEKYSGFNSQFGLGSKLGIDGREKAVQKYIHKIEGLADEKTLKDLGKKVHDYLLSQPHSKEGKDAKDQLRTDLMALAKSTKNQTLIDETRKMVYRPVNEMYIPIKNSKKLHDENPNFFGDQIGEFKENSKKLLHPKEERQFNLVFEPSGTAIRSFITQDYGKGIESCEHQDILGNWILREVFQLAPDEPLTTEKLNEVGKNGIKLYRTDQDDDVHLEFIWIDDDNLPEDYIE